MSNYWIVLALSCGQISDTRPPFQAVSSNATPELVHRFEGEIATAIHFHAPSDRLCVATQRQDSEIRDGSTPGSMIRFASRIDGKWVLSPLSTPIPRGDILRFQALGEDHVGLVCRVRTVSANGSWTQESWLMGMEVAGGAVTRLSAFADGIAAAPDRSTALVWSFGGAAQGSRAPWPNLLGVLPLPIHRSNPSSLALVPGVFQLNLDFRAPVIWSPESDGFYLTVDTPMNQEAVKTWLADLSKALDRVPPTELGARQVLERMAKGEEDPEGEVATRRILFWYPLKQLSTPKLLYQEENHPFLPHGNVSIVGIHRPSGRPLLLRSRPENGPPGLYLLETESKEPSVVYRMQSEDAYNDSLVSGQNETSEGGRYVALAVYRHHSDEDSRVVSIRIVDLVESRVLEFPSHPDLFADCVDRTLAVRGAWVSASEFLFAAGGRVCSVKL